MTRSDLILEVGRVVNDSTLPVEPRRLVSNMHFKIERVYQFLFDLEAVGNKNPGTPIAKAMTDMAAILRARLEY